MSTDPEQPKPLRADARRNRARILIAADEVFADKGPSASTEEVAQRAGVAIGTVFRHFPTKPDLAEAVFVERLRQLTAEAGEAGAADDAGAAFMGFLQRWADLAAAKLAVADAFVREGVDVAAVAREGEYPQVRAELLAAVDNLLRRAQVDGAVRDDIGIVELDAILVGIARAIEHAPGAGHIRSRVLAVVLDGLGPNP